MANYREIVTKAVIAKGKKLFTTNNTVKVDKNPSTILGCWVINHNFNGVKSGDNIRINGSYDVNIWYSYDSDSKTNVISEKLDYNDIFNVKVRENADLSGDTEIIVRSLKQPTCSKVTINENGDINFDIEKELGVEIVGETKVKIEVEEDEEPWDDVIDEDEVNKEIDKVNDDYLEKGPEK